MPLFICSKCRCVESTALSDYWVEWMHAFREKRPMKPLCSACDPTSDTQGQWHGKFPRQPWNGREPVLNPPASSRLSSDPVKKS